MRGALCVQLQCTHPVHDNKLARTFPRGKYAVKDNDLAHECRERLI